MHPSVPIAGRMAMRCTTTLAVLFSVVCGLTVPRIGFAQLPYPAAADAAGQIYQALDNKYSSSDLFAQMVNSELVQIGRVILYFNQLTAQERATCGGHISAFFGYAGFPPSRMPRRETHTWRPRPVGSRLDSGFWSQETPTKRRLRSLTQGMRHSMRIKRGFGLAFIRSAWPARYKTQTDNRQRHPLSPDRMAWKPISHQFQEKRS